MLEITARAREERREKYYVYFADVTWDPVQTAIPLP